MPTIEELIRQEINPFDQINFKPGNFWTEAQELALVESIHQQELWEIEALLKQVAQDHRSRTVLLLGDSGSGKSHLLGRLKQSLNDQAFFAYIGPWADSDHVWRHTLRYTVDSLMQEPAGQQESQLMLWLKSLSVFTKRSKKQRVFDYAVWELLQSNRQNFVQHLKRTYKTVGLYNPDMFFGVLYDLMSPELYPLACEWLRGDDLSEESMQALRVRQCIDSEDAAKGVLANFGRISTATQPIVLCYDQLDNIPRFADGSQDFQALFNINTSIHNEPLKNFLVVISVITNTWNQVINRVQPSELARIERELRLKRINLAQAEALWSYHLSSLHQAATSKPASALFPLTANLLEAAFPSGKTTPRAALTVAQQEYQSYKLKLIHPIKPPVKPTPKPVQVVKVHPSRPSVKPPVKPAPKPVQSIKPSAELPVELPVEPIVEPSDQAAKPGTAPITQPTVLPPVNLEAEFQLLWQKEQQKVQGKLTKITLRSAPELLQMLREALSMLEIPQIQPKLLPGKFSSYSCAYSLSNSSDLIGLVWTEDSGMKSFYDIMNACQKLSAQTPQLQLRLIRAGTVGKPSLAGHQIYRQVFTGDPHRHLRPALGSVQQLATYHSLVNSVLAQELVVGGQTISLKELEALTRQTRLLHSCKLLIDLDLLKGDSTETQIDPIQAAKTYIHNLVLTQQFIGRKVVVDSVLEKFVPISQFQVDDLITQLCTEQKISVINPNAKLSDQSLCVFS